MNTEEKKENLESLQEENNTVETNSTQEEESNLEESNGCLLYTSDAADE